MQPSSTDSSLSEVNASVDAQVKGPWWRRFAAFFGPAYLVSVGYMDPGNWATDLAGGSQFGYRLLWVLLMSNIMALLLQSLSARLGIVRKRDLAQCNRELYPKSVNAIFYVLAELAIAACDLAEVLGMAIGLQLLLGIPLLWGVGITLLDTLLLLYLQKLGIRKLEAFIIALVAIIGICFGAELLLARPEWSEVVKGLSPSLPNSTALYIAIGIIGATVMPHNLYLHSALVQTRKVGTAEKDIRRAIRFNNLDSFIALNAAFFVNAAILILAATTFHNNGHTEVATLHEAHHLLSPMLGSTWASHLFAIALIAAGQSSTVTGTLAGQIVMEGYLRLRINPWARRLLTRLLAIVPAVIVIVISGESEVDSLLIFSQVLLSMQLAFAVVPLIHFVSDRQRMGLFTIGISTKIAAWVVAAIIIVLNLKLVHDTAAGWREWGNLGIDLLSVLVEAGLAVLLAIAVVLPLVRKGKTSVAVSPDVHRALPFELTAPTHRGYRQIGIAVDFTRHDQQSLEAALRLADGDTHFCLIHVVESAGAKITGAATADAETQQDEDRLKAYATLLSGKGYTASYQLGYRNRASEIARMVREQQLEILVVGSHGHRGLGDLLMGETIDAVRHKISIPIFIAR
ncbi:MAG: iron/manganese transporter [Sphingobacteriales bacterium]|nr:MAG: iron/manganese transporter [Sphingobacteriales bacterium]